MRGYWICLLIIMGTAIFDAKAEYRLTKDDVDMALKQEFNAQGYDDIEIEVFGGKTDYYFEQANDAKILLSNFDLREDQGRFSADAEIFADGVETAKTKFVGKFYPLAKVWVPIADIAKGKVVQVADLQEIVVRKVRLKNGVWSDIADITGKQATKNLKAGKLIEKGDLQAEVIIKKGQNVTAIYNKKGLQITSKMQALEDAAAGEMIKLLNLNSKKEITGEAKASGLVEINNE